MSNTNEAPVFETGAQVSTLVATSVGNVALAEAPTTVPYLVSTADTEPVVFDTQPAESPQETKQSTVVTQPRLRETQHTAIEGEHPTWLGFVRGDDGVVQPKLDRPARVRERQARREAEARARVEAAATAQAG